MKLLLNFAFAACLFTTISVKAQKSSNSRKTAISTTVKDTAAGSEGKLNQYKSKQWHQGVVTPEETKSGEKTKPDEGTKQRKSRKTPPTPVPGQPPTGLPPTK
jgi:hypothetical protein